MELDFAISAARTAARHPCESAGRLRGRIDTRRDQRAVIAAGGPDRVYPGVADPAAALHEALGLPMPCNAAAVFEATWAAIVRELRAIGARVGLASYRGWNDGDRSMAAAVWCLVAHLHPLVVVETGVAHGLTSRVILEGLERNRDGCLISIDLPAVDATLHGEIGMAVPARLAHRWIYLAGTSRAHLPALVDHRQAVDLFVHDSLHTERNTRFELDVAWPALRPGGAAVVDDIHRSLAFQHFADECAPARWFVANHQLGSGKWGVALKKRTSIDGRGPDS